MGLSYVNKMVSDVCSPHTIPYPGTVYLQQTCKIALFCATHNVTDFVAQMGLYSAQ